MSRHTDERGTVLIYSARAREPEHEKTVHFELGKRIASMLGMQFGGTYDAAAVYPRRRYFIPTETLIGMAAARQVGIRHEGDLFGGVAPHAFVPTKAITHPLVEANACAPAGWSHEFGQRVQHSVLRGVTVFTMEDALKAGERLLAHGPVRIKPVHATAGRGQLRVDDRQQLLSALQAQDTSRLRECGLVLEEHLEQATTFSVGQVRLGGIRASYVGTQQLTPDNSGTPVYGGSALLVARGDFNALLKLNIKDEFRQAIAKAQIYDTAATACFAGLLASRRNYDIACGLGADGQIRCGVLEQSWRVGGASAAEITALQAFHADPSLQATRASTIELFGTRVEAPEKAYELYRGTDPDIGPLSKYVKVEPYDD
jgi:hypothetical protein